MSDSVLKILELAINGGLGLCLVKVSLMLGEIALKMENRLTALETDAKWLKQACGKRASDRRE